jgi:hypothetical protein
MNHFFNTPPPRKKVLENTLIASFQLKIDNPVIKFKQNVKTIILLYPVKVTRCVRENIAQNVAQSVTSTVEKAAQKSGLLL